MYPEYSAEKPICVLDWGGKTIRYGYGGYSQDPDPQLDPSLYEAFGGAIVRELQEELELWSWQRGWSYQAVDTGMHLWRTEFVARLFLVYLNPSWNSYQMNGTTHFPTIVQPQDPKHQNPHWIAITALAEMKNAFFGWGDVLRRTILDTPSLGCNIKKMCAKFWPMDSMQTQVPEDIDMQLPFVQGMALLP
jgi:hypothetical protein